MEIFWRIALARKTALKCGKIRKRTTTEYFKFLIMYVRPIKKRTILSVYRIHFYFIFIIFFLNRWINFLIRLKDFSGFNVASHLQLLFRI